MLKVNEVNKNRLDEMGVIPLWGEITDGLAGTICEKIITLNCEDRIEFIQLLINSPGGSCHAAFSIIDFIAWSKLPVRTIGVGLVASAALTILVAGANGHRVITPNTSILAHRFSASHAGNHAELIAARREEDYMHQRLLKHFICHSNLNTASEIESRLLREVDTWLYPAEAVEIGIVDSVLDSTGMLIPKNEGSVT